MIFPSLINRKRWVHCVLFKLSTMLPDMPTFLFFFYPSLSLACYCLWLKQLLMKPSFTHFIDTHTHPAGFINYLIPTSNRGFFFSWWLCTDVSLFKYLFFFFFSYFQSRSWSDGHPSPESNERSGWGMRRDLRVIWWIVTATEYIIIANFWTVNELFFSFCRLTAIWMYRKNKFLFPSPSRGSAKVLQNF